MNNKNNIDRNQLMFKTGIVILTYNNWKLVFQLVDLIQYNDMFNYIVIVDNCSKDDTWNQLTSRYKSHRHIKVIHAKENGGYAKGNNLGAKWLINNTDVTQIFFANPDIIIEKNSVLKVSLELEKGEYAILAPVMLNTDNTIDDENYWDEPTYGTELLNCFFLYRIVTAKKRRKRIDCTIPIMQVFAVTGSFFGIRRDVFEEIGGFDSGTFLFCEENILGTRLKNKGYRTGIVTGISYIHNHSIIIDYSMKVVKKYKIQLDSHYYYVRNYLCKNMVLNRLLRCAQIVSLMGLQLYLWIVYIKQKLI